jgi:hypothetical protein
LKVLIGGRNLGSNTPLVCEFGQWVDGAFVLHQSQTVAAPRETKISIQPAGAGGTISVIAHRALWTISMKAADVPGTYTVRVRSVDDSFPTVERSLLLDNALPTSVIAQATSENPMLVYLSMLTNPSGVKEVTVNMDGKPGVSAMMVQPTDSPRWVVQLKTAQQVLDLNLTTSAGKTTSLQVPVRLAVVQNLGTIVGSVFEGTIAQPNLLVNVIDGAGKKFTVQTDQDGKYSLSLTPGKITASVVKKSSQRQAADSVIVERDKTSTLDLHLLHPKPAATR